MITVEAWEVKAGDRMAVFAHAEFREVAATEFQPPHYRHDNGGVEVTYADGTTQVLGAAGKVFVMRTDTCGWCGLVTHPEGTDPC